MPSDPISDELPPRATGPRPPGKGWVASGTVKEITGRVLEHRRQAQAALTATAGARLRVNSPHQSNPPVS